METSMEGTKPGKTRRRLNEQAWKVLMKRFDGAALTVQEFCAREGLSLSSFRLWRSRLRPTLGPVSSAVSTSAPGATPQSPFVDLGLLGASAVRDHAALDLHIELGGGISLHLVRR
jgi:putative transposase